MCNKFCLYEIGLPKIGRFLQNIRKQKLGILFIMLITTSICAWYAQKLPNVYESRAILEIKLVDNFFPLNKGRKNSLNRRLVDAIDRELLNDSSLESLIIQNGLFDSETAKGDSIETVKNKIRRNLSVERVSRRTFDSVLFSLSYRDSNPEKARLVLSALTEKLADSQAEVFTDEHLILKPACRGLFCVQHEEQTIKVLSPPNEPYRPIAPKRFGIVGFGLVSGLFLGLFLATIYGFPEIFIKKPQ